MIPRYVIINIEERNEFEKEFQLPYGYANCFITDDLKDAIDQLVKYRYEYSGCSIEKIDEVGREVVYRQ